MPKRNTLEQLEARLADANRLIDIHVDLTGEGPGRRYEVDALNRSAIILAVAAWEAFVEDLAKRNCASLARRLKNAEDLPGSIKAPLLVWLYEKSNFKAPTPSAQAAMWSLAGHGWREVLREFAAHKAKNLNTPNSENVTKLFRCTLGIHDITESWGYRRWGAETYREKLDAVLTLRHRVAHGAINTETVGKTRAKDAINLVSSLADRSVTKISEHFSLLDLQGRKAKIRPA